MESIDRSDFAPETLSSPQIRDFANRVLRPVLDRFLPECSDYVDFSAILYSPDRDELDFSGRIDHVDKSIRYEVTVKQFFTMEDWTPEASLAALTTSFHSVRDQYPYEDFINPDDQEEDEIDDIPEGFVAVYDCFSFRVPIDRTKCIASKALRIEILDEDYDEIDEEAGFPVYNWDDEPLDVEPLPEHKKVIGFDVESLEVQLSSLTIADLELILGSFKKFGFSSTRMKALSRRVCPNS